MERWLPGAGRGERGAAVELEGVAVWRNEKVLETDSGDGCPAT